MRKTCTTAIGGKILFILLTVLSAPFLRAQITVSSLVPGNLSAAAAVVFGFRNMNASPFIVTDFSQYVPTGFSVNYLLWYRMATVTGAPTAINTTNGWLAA